MTTNVDVGATHLASQQVAGAHTLVNDILNRLGANVHLAVIDRDLTTPPSLSSPADDGKRYIVAASATGDWSGKDGQVALWYGGWIFFPHLAGWTAWIVDEAHEVRSDGTDWQDGTAHRVSASITASTTQTQAAAVQLVAGTNHVSVCANANDAVKLPAARAGSVVTVINRGANTLQVFPAESASDKIDDGAADASVTIATNKVATFSAIDGTDWYMQTGV
jgi:hypothetical protein